MSAAPLRIAMWSGPRNISTAMMRSFENRPDCAVIDEPFYACYLKATGAQHPMRDEVLASQPLDWREVVRGLLGPVPHGRAVFYQKHMTHHMLPGIGRDWILELSNAFLIRAPEDVLLSYVDVRGTASAEEIGVPQQRELFERVADHLGHAPPVVDTHDVLRNPKAVLGALCQALGIGFSDRMLSWPAGRRESDGVWAPAWYASVENSTGFSRPRVERRVLPDSLARIADEVRADYERLSAFRLGAG